MAHQWRKKIAVIYMLINLCERDGIVCDGLELRPANDESLLLSLSVDALFCGKPSAIHQPVLYLNSAASALSIIEAEVHDL